MWVVRGWFLLLKFEDYVMVVCLIGVSEYCVIIKYMLLVMIFYIIVVMIFVVFEMIFGEMVLLFFGLGLCLLVVSWGVLL